MPGPTTTPAGYHYQWFHFAVRERMKKQNGRADNHLMWRGVVPAERSWAVLERWVTAVKADRVERARIRQGRAQQAGGRRRRLLEGGDRRDAGDVHRRAADLQQSAGLRVQQDLPVVLVRPPGRRRAARRQRAQVPAEADRCRRTTPRRSNAADLQRLRRIFPDGVCDWSKPGVSQVPVRAVDVVRSGAGRPADGVDEQQ